MNRRARDSVMCDAPSAMRGPWPRRRRAFTLLELLLVLAVLAAMAAITWPALQNPLAAERLVKAAELVRVEWTRARVRAMSTGCTMVFRHQPENGRYVVEPWEGAVATSSELDGVQDVGIPSRVATLPDGVLFTGTETAFDTRSAQAAAEDQAQGDPTLGEPIYFYPDGTTSDARLWLSNRQGHVIELTLRGLTGIATVRQPQSLEY